MVSAAITSGAGRPLLAIAVAVRVKPEILPQPDWTKMADSRMRPIKAKPLDAAFMSCSLRKPLSDQVEQQHFGAVRTIDGDLDLVGDHGCVAGEEALTVDMSDAARHVHISPAAGFEHMGHGLVAIEDAGVDRGILMQQHRA